MHVGCSFVSKMIKTQILPMHGVNLLEFNFSSWDSLEYANCERPSSWSLYKNKARTSGVFWTIQQLSRL